MLCRHLGSLSIVEVFLLIPGSVAGRMSCLLLRILQRIGLLIILDLW